MGEGERGEGRREGGEKGEERREGGKNGGREEWRKG